MFSKEVFILNFDKMKKKLKEEKILKKYFPFFLFLETAYEFFQENPEMRKKTLYILRSALDYLSKKLKQTLKKISDQTTLRSKKREAGKYQIGEKIFSQIIKGKLVDLTSEEKEIEEEKCEIFSSYMKQKMPL